VLIKVLAGTDRPEVSREVNGCGDRWDEEMTTRCAAVRALGQIGDVSAVPVLIDAMRQTMTRADSAMALVRFGEVVVAPLLTMLSRESDDNIRYHIHETLAKVGWRPGRV
jgi:HEAT repeat protein